MSISIFSHLSSEKLPKYSFSQHNDKIIKCINHKIIPLNMSSKAKGVIDRKNLIKRPTFNEFSYFKDKSSNSFDKINQSHQSFIVYRNQLSMLDLTLPDEINLKKSHTQVELKQKNSQQSDTGKTVKKLTIERLPTIRKDISNRKEELVRSLQKQSLLFQKDKFNESQDKIYNLEYLLNRIAVFKEKKRSIMVQKQLQPLKGYENLSPNKLKQYIQYFKKKKNTTQVIYTSKKRIPLPRSSTQMDQNLMKRKLRKLQTMVNLKSQKKLNNTKSKKELSTTKKTINFQSVTKKQIKKTHIEKK